jgi:uncharacterized membrane-anchored protein
MMHCIIVFKQSRQNRASGYQRLHGGRHVLNKVPEVTIFFWIIKIACTTVGETAADYLNMRLGLGLTGTTVFMSSLLVVALIVQFRSKAYVPWIYWLSVVLISVVGTLITDNLTDHYKVSLVTSTIGFSIALAVVFAVWYAIEKTLSVHTIVTPRREAFYWLAILFTFALGTAAGDLISERFRLGYPLSVIIFGVVIAAIAVAHWRFKMNAVLAFWIAYILTRPLGASLGDFLAQSRNRGGLGLGTTVTSVLCLAVILLIVIYLTRTSEESLLLTQGSGLPPTP